MVRTIKDSFWNSIEYVTYRQKKDEELLKFLALFDMYFGFDAKSKADKKVFLSILQSTIN